MLGAGARNRKVTFQRALVALNAFGNEDRTWATIGSEWAHKHDLSAGERERSSEISSEVSVRFTVLHSDLTEGLRPQDRMQCGGLTYDIIAKREKSDGFRREIELDGAARDDLKPAGE
jgi:head-tail adaptor